MHNVSQTRQQKIVTLYCCARALCLPPVITEDACFIFNIQDGRSERARGRASGACFPRSPPSLLRLISVSISINQREINRLLLASSDIESTGRLSERAPRELYFVDACSAGSRCRSVTVAALPPAQLDKQEGLLPTPMSTKCRSTRCSVTLQFEASEVTQKVMPREKMTMVVTPIH